MKKLRLSVEQLKSNTHKVTSKTACRIQSSLPNGQMEKGEPLRLTRCDSMANGPVSMD